MFLTQRYKVIFMVFMKMPYITMLKKTYGGSMKSLMRKQVSSLNEEEIDVLSKYIYSLNH